MSDKEFMWALKNGDLDEVKDYVAKFGRGLKEQQTPVRWLNSPQVHGSIREQHSVLICLLLSLKFVGKIMFTLKGEDVNRTLEGGRKPLHYAADCGQLEILEFLLLKGADINGADKTVKGPDGLTAFEATDNQAIKTLLQ
ncbi:hypothetical protein DUI87_20054 [Hirundo rustica rustica]|uniref:Uncharacterized protein n=1 Tax=Hirundo rustica rustica TaxID=333673 RepID=A0A3M0JPB9_HIRRU|nr:hypothetical protein DUI87_20054 [Hirundo rustica rustica]